MTGIVDTMERHGLVQRIPNPDDRRSTLVKLLPKGRSKLEATPELEQLFGSCCGDLTKRELRSLGRLLRRLDAALSCEPR